MSGYSFSVVLTGDFYQWPTSKSNLLPLDSSVMGRAHESVPAVLAVLAVEMFCLCRHVAQRLPICRITERTRSLLYFDGKRR